VTRRRADVLLVAATLLWGSSFVVVKGALAHSSPLAFLALRFGVAALLLAPFVRWRPLPDARELAAGLLLGTLLATGFAANTVGLVYTTPSRSAFIVASSSVLAPLVAFLVVRERPRWTALAALAVATVGMYFLTDPSAGGLNRGDLWTLVTAVAFGGQIVAVGELGRRFDVGRLVWMQTAITAAVAGILAGVAEDVRVEWVPAFLGAVAYCAVFATAVALVWQMRAQREMSSTRAALLFCCEPVFAAAASWLVWGERLSGAQWLGGALILGGMILADLPQRRAAGAPSPC
jgi:drug/metabolite transporter (DMT)-like permease